ATSSARAVPSVSGSERRLHRAVLAAVTAGRSPPATRSRRSLPNATTSLFGREEAIDEVTGLLQRPGAALVTLTGPGGIGKTRLALAVGKRVRHQFDA